MGKKILKSSFICALNALIFVLLVGTTRTQIPLYIAGMSIQGAKTEQQDRYYITQNTAHEGLVAGIFDGHGSDGDKFAQMAKEKFVTLFEQYKEQFEGNVNQAKIKRLITEIFKKVNAALWKQYGHTQGGGTTALIAFRKDDTLFIAHCGDSRAVWGKNRSMQTKDHTGSNVKEIRRVGRKNIISVRGVPRLGGTLMVTRSLADFDLKQKGLSGTPEIVTVNLKKHPLVILGCDGLWDGTSSKMNKRSEQNDNNSFLYDLVLKTVPEDRIVGWTEHDVVFAIKKIITAAICSTLDPQGRCKALQNLENMACQATKQEVTTVINKFDWTKAAFFDHFIQENQQYVHDNTTAIIIYA
jgi:serine/threonine protein phosphatase PrpC